jgi:RNA polymerase sigma factor (sigma-70 family)
MSFLDAFAREEPSAIERARALARSVVRGRRYAIPLAEQDDLVQDVMLQLLRLARDEPPEPDRRFETLVRVVAARRCIDWLRTHRATRALGADPPDQRESPVEAVMGAERVRLMREALDQLGPSCRDLIERRVARSMSYRQIAEDLDRSIGALRVQMHECIQRARDILSRLMETGRQPRRGPTEA